MMRIKLLLFALLGCTTALEDKNKTNNDTNLVQHAVYNPDKEHPAKGDDNGTDAITLPPNNSIEFDLYLALTAESRSLGYLLKKVLTCYMNIRSKEYNFEHPRPDTLDMLCGFFSERNPEADLLLVLADPKLYSKEPNVWWWKYRFRYDCFWPNTQDPMAEGLEEIKDQVDSMLQELMKLRGLQQELLEQLGFESFFELQMEPPPMPMPPPPQTTSEPGAYTSGGSTAQDDQQEAFRDLTRVPTQSPTPVDNSDVRQVMQPIDTSTWDWRRYLGLGLLISTVSMTVCLVQMAAYRRRLLRKKNLWGNLATEEGVDELLRTGWRVRGSKMEIYDKKLSGYSDDNSMLMGGFEQSEMLGAEITLTQSETTPDSP